ncbi:MULTISPECIES: MurR/RpiR family transcriptional regulator [Aerococcus]|nr:MULTISPECIES: MurR/RpiR family transcriptional regulator [Aerococcus]MDK6688151.1 MurR/RpiR family transcriptional regulator [Aerococcus urinae]MDK8132729.1 MurR/RpiR family transcriptional regulator [Aerococcus urinae]MDK8484351.1 MurR/RpiR family transcriptional regulator [Aerococcus urinae]MDL5179367.1 MurR/RpiR family transcriptional regulator [Aerococcus tenax]MDL5208268.1 MurR/RpiR family transcriptional regulator [Aerococcus tenax]
MIKNIHKMILNEQLSDTEKSILYYLKENQNILLNLRINDVAKANFTSPSTVFRLAKKIGFSGYKELMYYLSNLSEGGNLHSIDRNITLDFANHLYLMLKNNENSKMNFISSLSKKSYIAIIAQGYSAIIAEYLYKKLLVKNYKSIILTSTDSMKILENNINDISHLIIITRSGETKSLIRLMKLVYNSPLKLFLSLKIKIAILPNTHIVYFQFIMTQTPIGII